MTTRVLVGAAAALTLTALAVLVVVTDVLRHPHSEWAAMLLAAAAASFAHGAAVAPQRRPVLVTTSACVLVLGLLVWPQVGVLLLSAALLGLVAAREDALRGPGAAGP